MAQPKSLSTILRHPLASKRCMMVFNQNGEETMELFELLSRYEAVGPIGQGSYGYVCSARDNDLVERFQVKPPEEYEDDSLTPEERDEIYDTNTLVAVKKLHQLFESNQSRMWLCATREIQLMMTFQHDNVMSATDFFIPLGEVDMMTYHSILQLQLTFDSVYVVMKKMDYTLREVLDSTTVTAAELAPAYETWMRRVKMLIAKCNEEKAEAARAESSGQAPHLKANPGAQEEDQAVAKPHKGTGQSSRQGTEDGGDETGAAAPTSSDHPGAATSAAPTGDHDASLVKTAAEDGIEEKKGGSDNAEGVPVCCPLTTVALHSLTRDYRKFILYQIFRGVGYLHLCPVIHRDLKPENIMLDRSYGTRITDFGQGRDVGLNATADYVQTVLDNCTQWYAAPETLTVAINSTMGFMDHDSFHGVDVWSIGCIAAEMLIGRPLFYTTSMGGKYQLLSIFRVLGQPSASAIESIAEYRDKETRELFINSIKKLVKTAPPPCTITPTLAELLRSPYGDEDEDEVGLIIDCLRWDPRERITIQAALHNAFFTKDGYDPVIDPDDTVKRAPSVRPEDISEPVSGRAFLWNLFLQRHPEVKELWNSLVAKHEEELEEPKAPKAEDP
ncbi:protein kinase, putative [Leishmania panamensis]|uniref:Protein kinase, putative n=1 Tax=Leishmania panamensis TaxID=5679 RepID=A0A088S4R5_LEIPA|nr:protein kinase, putative [Leishmania panamensis]AIN96496.1 protein kinase, putative [Leishmania panamensis]